VTSVLFRGGCGRDRSVAVQAISRRIQLELIGAGYAAVLLFGVFEFFQRYLYTLREPIDSAGGMAAFGDAMLTVFVALLFLVPTFFLLRWMAQADGIYAVYSKILLAVSLTAPLSMGLLALFHRSETVQNVCVTRFLWAPFLLLVMAMRRSLGKRLITWALLIEAGTLIAGFAVFAVLAGVHR